MSEIMKPRISTQITKSVYSRKTFGEIFGYLTNNTFSRDLLSSRISSYRNVHYGDILVKYGEILDVTNEELPFISANVTDKAKLFPLLNNGDVIIADTAEDETVGKCTEIENVGDAKIIAGLHTMACRPKVKFAPGFLGFYMNSPKYHDQLLPLMQGTKVTSVSKTAILETKLLYPPFEEQKDIVHFLTSLNKAISKNESAIAKWQDIKKAYRSMLFPRPGEKKPRIRFKEFRDDWGFQPLNNYACKVTTKNTAGAVSESFTNSAEFGIVSQLDFFDHEITKESNNTNYFVVNEDDFVYNPRISTFAPVGPINRNKLGRKGIMSPLYMVFSIQGIDPVFLEYYFQTNLWHHYMKMNGNTGARHDRFSISDENFFNMPIPAPCLAEQRAIGTVLDNIDKLISTQSRRLLKLRHLKSACLDGMFVNE